MYDIQMPVWVAWALVGVVAIVLLGLYILAWVHKPKRTLFWTTAVLFGSALGWFLGMAITTLLENAGVW